MKKISNYVIVGTLVCALAGVMILKGSGGKCPFACKVDSVQSPAAVPAAGETEMPAALPKLIDLGAGKCIPCKMMAPILEEMKTQYAGKLDVTFYDVWENPDKAKEYGVNIIPTQIFYDAAGKELFRHEGFFSKEDILGKFKEFGIELSGGEKTTGQ